MDSISTILIPFDFSKTSKNALDYTINFIGQDKKIKILLAYISEDMNDEAIKEAFEKLQDEYSNILKSPMEWVSEPGSSIESIMDIQKKQKTDFIIMGTSGADSKADGVPTNSSRLVVQALCPMLVIPENIKEFSIEKIALVLGKDEIENKSVLETLLYVSRRFNAKVHVVTIENEEGIYGYSKVDEKNENLLEYYLENFYSHHSFIENKDILKGVAEYTQVNDIDIVAIFPHHHTQENAPSAGRLTKELTMHSKVPILAIE